MKQRRFGLGLASAVLALVPAASPGALAGEALTDVPARADAKAHYLFYMHGAWLEMHGEGRPHPAFGRYQQRDNVEALAKRGFVVIGEARPANTRFPAYAGKVAGQVRRLLNQGVLPSNVTVIGHSKGGKGHGLFYTPIDIWIEVIEKWAGL